MDLNVNAFRVVQRLTQGKQKSKSGHAGGVIGGPARAAKLTPDKRKAIAMKANQMRWKKREDGDVSKDE